MPSPLEISIVVHYTNNEIYDFRDLDMPAIKAAVSAFLDAGILEMSPTNGTRLYEPTEGLDMWVEALCAVQPPRLRQQWVMEENAPEPPRDMARVDRLIQDRIAAGTLGEHPGSGEKAGPEWGGPEWRKNPFGTAYTAAVRDFVQFDPARNVPGRGTLGQVIGLSERTAE